MVLYVLSPCPLLLLLLSPQPSADYSKANIEDWTPNETYPYAGGTGRYGSCCAEVNVWEANAVSAAFLAHPCTSSVSGQTSCEGDACANTCDADGCDFNAYRMGAQTFYGEGKVVDSTSEIVVVTQFITADGTDEGDLVEIRRFYEQDGVVIENAATNVAGMGAYNSISGEYCADQKAAFGDVDEFTPKGGLVALGEAFERGMVLVMGISGYYDEDLTWLDRFVSEVFARDRY